MYASALYARCAGRGTFATMPEAGTNSASNLRSVESVRDMIMFPETVFMLGGSLDRVDERIRDLDAKKRLGIGNVLDATPPVWVHLDAFSIMRKMVTNGEYLEFLSYEDEEGRFYDSNELWRHVWAELGFHVDTAQMPYRAADGTVRYYEEMYSACANFIEAYVQSLFHEIQYVFLGLPEEHSGGADGSGAMRPGAGATRDHILKRLFALIKFKLRGAISSGEGDGLAALTDEERDLLGEYKGIETANEDVEFIVKELRRGYGRQVDHRLEQAFKKGQLAVEPVLFLERFALAVRADPKLESAVPLHLVLYPRRWKTSQGQSQRRRLLGTAVPWEDCPVTGVSFFEALAYAAWLSSVTGTNLTLPNEAQFERASSWPIEDPPSGGGPLRLDSRKKLLFPWQDHCPHDFNFFFAREGFEIEGYYQKNAEAYRQLMEQTARRLGDGRSIYQLQGFGWHWTSDRYSETERKYNRFDDPEYPRYTAVPCIEPGGARAKVYHYVPNRNPKDSFIVLRGSPDVLGGPGLTTRRYAAYPLRGYVNVGYRLVCQAR